MPVTESLVSAQNEAAHQHSVQTIQQGMLQMFAQATAATGAAIVQSILNPGSRAQATSKVLETDVPGEGIRMKGMQTVPPISSPPPVT